MDIHRNEVIARLLDVYSVRHRVIAQKTTPFRDEVNLLRAKQAVIAKTIRQLDPVANATVEIAKPESSPFLREKQPTTAAVMVQLKPNATLARSQVAGIVAFVAKSVEGLAPENVTVVDSKGNQLSEPGGPEAGVVSSQLDYRRAVETYLAEKAQSILIPALGAGRAVVKVTADINFQRLKEVRDTINPEQKAIETERTTTSKNQYAGRDAALGQPLPGPSRPGRQAAGAGRPGRRRPQVARGRAAPQINLFTVGFPLRLAAGLVLLFLMLPNLLHSLVNALGRFGELLTRLV